MCLNIEPYYPSFNFYFCLIYFFPIIFLYYTNSVFSWSSTGSLTSLNRLVLHWSLGLLILLICPHKLDEFQYWFCFLHLWATHFFLIVTPTLCNNVLYSPYLVTTSSHMSVFLPVSFLLTNLFYLIIPFALLQAVLLHLVLFLASFTDCTQLNLLFFSILAISLFHVF